MNTTTGAQRTNKRQDAIWDTYKKQQAEKMKNELTEIFGEVISSYSRKQAIEDGVLNELPDAICKEAGIKYPIVVTNAIQEIIDRAVRNGKDYEGVVWDILTLFRFAARRGGEEMTFIVKIGRKNETIKAVCHGGDEGEPVITFMLPGED